MTGMFSKNRLSAFAKTILCCRSFHKNRAGATAVEFALILPVLVLIYVSTVEITQAIAAQRKVAIAAGTIGDLTAQYETMNNENIGMILRASAAVLKPFSAESLNTMTSRVASIKFNGAGTAQRDWSYSMCWCGDSGVVGPTEDDDWALTNLLSNIPNDLKVPNTSVIVSEITFDYTSPFQLTFTSVKSMHQVSYFRPRLGMNIPFQGSTSGTAWPNGTTGTEAGLIDEDYVGFGPEYMLEPRSVPRDSGTPDSPPSDLQNAWYCDTGNASCDPSGAGGPGGPPMGGGGGGCRIREPLLEIYLMPIDNNVC